MNFGDTFRAYVYIHVAVVLFGFTAILGALIDLTALEIVWWRVLLTAISLIFLVRGGRSLAHLSMGDRLKFLGIGCIVALHWLCFYGAIKYSNASITLVCMATSSFFTSLVEPLLLKKPFNFLDIFLGLLVIPGMVLVVQNIEVTMMLGVWVGLLSALLAAIFASLNKKYIDNAHPYTITFLEMTGSWLFLTVVMPILFAFGWMEWTWPDVTDWTYLIILSLLCTTLAFILALKALKHVSAFASNLVVNLEPVYGILLAVVLLNEHKELDPRFYLGCLAILTVVILHPIITRRRRLKAEANA